MHYFRWSFIRSQQRQHDPVILVGCRVLCNIICTSVFAGLPFLCFDSRTSAKCLFAILISFLARPTPHTPILRTPCMLIRGHAWYAMKESSPLSALKIPKYMYERNARETASTRYASTRHLFHVTYHFEQINSGSDVLLAASPIFSGLHRPQTPCCISIRPATCRSVVLSLYIFII